VRYKPTNVEAELRFTQPVLTDLQRQEYVDYLELDRAQKFVKTDPKIIAQVLEVSPPIDLSGKPILAYRNLAFVDLYTRFATVAEGESIEARLLVEITTLQQQLAKLKALIVELEATSNTEDE